MNGLIEVVKTVIEQYGLAGIFTLTAAEQFIFPIPADGFIAIGTATGLLLDHVLLAVLAGTLIGSIIGYLIGKYLGHPILVWLFGEKKLERAEKFVKKWGVWGVIIAGITPIPFKLITIAAGAFELPFGRYLIGVIVGRMPRYLLVAYLGVLAVETQFYASPNMSAAILGVLQGVTEFLPISSSGHLILMEHFLPLPETLTPQKLEVFDIFVHGGSLLAIILYFWKDWVAVFAELRDMLKKKVMIWNSMAGKLVIGTIPAILAGLTLGDAISHNLRTTTSVAIFFMLIATYFLYAEWKGKRSSGEVINLKKAVLMGTAQAFALIPGVSRAGTTIATGMLSGLKRDIAARFSFLLGGIAILAANVYTLLTLEKGAGVPDIDFIAIGFVASFVTSFFAVRWLMHYLHNHTLRPFAAYLVIMGAVILSFL